MIVLAATRTKLSAAFDATERQRHRQQWVAATAAAVVANSCVRGTNNKDRGTPILIGTPSLKLVE